MYSAKEGVVKVSFAEVRNAAKNAAKIIPITAKAAPGLRNGADRYSTVG